MSSSTTSGRLRAAVLAAAVAWAAWGLGDELAALRRQVIDPPNPGAVAHWTLATPRIDSLRRFLSAARVRLPAGRVVAFDSSAGPGDQTYFLTLWVAYLLPEERVLRLQGPPAESGADYLLTYDTTRDDPCLEQVLRHPSGALYRILPAPATGAASTAAASTAATTTAAEGGAE